MNFYLEKINNIIHNKKDNNTNIYHDIRIGNSKLPDDYLLLLSNYSGITINNFIHILDPLSHNPNLNFSTSYYLINAYKELKEAFPEYYQLNIFPSEKSFFTWAITDNGSTFSWLIDNTNPNLWKIIILDSDTAEMEFFNMGCLEFLYKILTGEIKSNIMPSDFLIYKLL